MPYAGRAIAVNPVCPPVSAGSSSVTPRIVHSRHRVLRVLCDIERSWYLHMYATLTGVKPRLLPGARFCLVAVATDNREGPSVSNLPLSRQADFTLGMNSGTNADSAPLRRTSIFKKLNSDLRIGDSAAWLLEKRATAQRILNSFQRLV